MKEEHSYLDRKRRERVVRVKRILRWMPRRTNLHRYPVLKWFAKAARRRTYLWSFRVRAVVPALYAGGILAFLPLYGIQIPFAVAMAFLLRSNLPVIFSLQFISNPVTILPLYFTCFQVGRALLQPFGFEPPRVNMEEMNALIKGIGSGNIVTNFHYIKAVFLTTTAGSLILGTAFATIASGFYRLAAYEVTRSYQKLKKLQEQEGQSGARTPAMKARTPGKNQNPTTP